MFQPLLDAFMDSTQIEEVSSKPPLNIAVANWWTGNETEAEEFKYFILYPILSQHYEITLHANPNKPTDIVFSNPLGATRNILSYPNTKRIFYTSENQVPDFNLFDYAIGFDELEFKERYLRMPLYYAQLHRCAELTNDTTSPYKLKPNSPYSQTKPTHHFKTNHPHLCSVVNGDIDPLKREFASFVASNSQAPVRNAFYDALSSVGAIAGGGG
ncbi:alpha1,3-fucosyl transferase [Helicobacter cetorum MIT 99-5656]|uniref:Alpha1,3-fucosyl transferase n=1 Tax=Helicobacter cetorum (strain ATCC BAA-540 / CCUG 52418 / MIT 99-5656) TaxID=1163745 RepID=I0ETS7_HELCM|nr:alpha1,3-fucosyl transferase [Helicobacter cetorum MIT 99-5656]